MGAMTFDQAADHVIHSGRLQGRTLYAVHQNFGAHGLLALVELYHSLATRLSAGWIKASEMETYHALRIYLAAEDVHRQLCELRKNGQALRCSMPQTQPVDWNKVRRSIPNGL